MNREERKAPVAAEALRNSDNNTDSSRVVLTKRAICDAFKELVGEKGFNQVNAGDIIERAGVSRSTFYRCFPDKYEIAIWAYKRFKNIRLKDGAEYHRFDSSLLVQLDYLRENKDFFAESLRYRGQQSLHDAMIAINDEYMLQCWIDHHGTKPVPAQRELIRFAAAGSAAVVEAWVLDGCVLDPEELVGTVCSAIPPTVYETLY